MDIIIKTEQKKQVKDITEQVNEYIIEQDFKTGLCHLFLKHTTAALTCADLDPGTDLDYLDAFAALVPKLQFRHPHNPAHVPDHILSALIGVEVTLPVENGELNLGTWQRLVLVELDGPREREIVMSLRKV
jgi:secondary thiamine-phosphate synthase enzyme